MSFDNNQYVQRSIATGAIGAFRGIFQDPNSDNKVKVATANVRCLGIGPDYAISDGEAFMFSVGGTTQGQCGGTVTRGDRVKTDANGRFVTLAVGGTEIQNVIGIATRSGVSLDIIPIQIELWAEAPGDYLS